MTTLQFLNRLQSLNIRVALEGDNLRLRAVPGALTSALKAELSQRKPEIVKLLRQLPGGSLEKPPMRPAPRTGHIPLTFAQQRLWFLDQFHPGLPAYNICDINQIRHEIDVPALQRTFTELVRRHEILRTSFPAVEGVPLQHIAPPAEFPLSVVDLSALTEQERMLEVRRLATAEVRKPFDLARGPLFRAGLLRLGPGRYMSLVSIHHIICDDWSMKLLDQELETLYDSYRAGHESPLAQLPIQWADFACWQHQWLCGPVLDAHVSYWSTQLAGELPALNLVKDHPREEVASGGHGRFSFPPSLSSALRKLSESERVTLFMTLLAGYAALLARYTGQDDFIIGSPVSDRGCVEAESLIGFFLNTLPLRVKVDQNASFQHLLRHVKEVCLGAYSYQAVPYEALMQHLEVERDGSGTPVFQTMLALLNTPEIQSSSKPLRRLPPDWLPEVEIIEGEVGAYRSEEGNGATKFDLSLTVVESEVGMIRGRVEYNCDVFEEPTIATLIERLQRLLRSAAADPSRKIRDLELLTQRERADLLGSAGRGPQSSWDLPCLQGFLERQARLQPCAVAVEGQDECVTYGELNGQANRLARYLRAYGLAPEARIGVLFERSRQMVVAVLGVLKAGGAYVPLDPAHPTKRLESIIEDAGLDCLLTTETTAANLAPSSLRRVCLDRDAAAIAAHAADDLPDFASPENLACVLYTSGSTGRPKGVLLTHRAVANFIQGAIRDCAIASTDRVLQFASLAFDASLEEMLLAFSTGATLVLRPDRMLDTTAGFTRYCEQLRLTVLVLPTAYWHEVVATLHEHRLPSCVRCVVIGGERALPEKLACWQERVGRRILLINAYGPTEGTIAVTRYKVPGESAETAAGTEVAIGRPVANCTVYLLDRWMGLVPPGVPGELYLGGLAVARGYLGQPGLTAERFVADPFSGTPGARLYRTGDLARFLPDGTLEYRGRADAQVKIRGYRVEPREIEAALQEHAGVKDVLVITREIEPADKRLVAYVVAQQGTSLSAADLRAFLKPKLPAYMVPAAFVLLPVLPLNVNGKVNHRVLPPPETGRVDPVPGEERGGARTPTEKTLAAIWMTVLKLERIAVEEDFFELGGHSLLATQIVARVNDALRIDLPLRRLFDAPTIAELAVIVDSLVQAMAQPAPRPRQAVVSEVSAGVA